ncbi:MAG: hypothetical protein ACF8R7_13610 [Phycisphaerales bacterium JB039]
MGNRTARLAVAGVLLGLATAFCGPAAAQVQLDTSISQQVSPPMDDIQRWAAENVRNLASDDPVLVQRSKQALARPLRDAATTVGFRVRASEAIVPALRALIASRPDQAEVAVNAAIVASDLASDGGLALLRDLRADPRLAVRYRATKGFGNAMLLALQSEPAFDATAAMQVARDLGAGLSAETDPQVLVAYVTALEDTSKVDRFRGLRDLALQELAEGISARLDRLNGAPADLTELDPLVRGLGHFRSQLIRVGGDPVGPAARKAGVEAAGHLIAWAFRFTRANGAIPEPDSDLHRVLVTGLNLAENIFTLVDARQGETIERLRLKDLATGGSVQEFTNAAGRVIGVGGILAQAPYSVAEGTYRLK